jgi:hypothetical protein
MPLSFTPLLLRLKLLRACGQWHSSRVSTASRVVTASERLHFLQRHNAEGNGHTGCNPNPNPNPNPNHQSCHNAEGKRRPRVCFIFPAMLLARCAFFNHGFCFARVSIIIRLRLLYGVESFWTGFWTATFEDHALEGHAFDACY